MDHPIRPSSRFEVSLVNLVAISLFVLATGFTAGKLHSMVEGLEERVSRVEVTLDRVTDVLEKLEAIEAGNRDGGDE